MATATAIMTDLSSGLQIHILNLSFIYIIIYYVDVNVDLINNDSDSDSGFQFHLHGSLPSSLFVGRCGAVMTSHYEAP